VNPRPRAVQLRRVGNVNPARGGRQPAVIVVGPYPPPIHGAARVTRLVSENLRAAGAAVRAVDTSGVTDRSRVAYHLSRIWSHVRAVGVVARAGREVTSVYLAGAGGFGLWYQLVVVVVARTKGYRVVFHHHSYASVRHRTLAMKTLTRAGGRSLVHVVLCDGMADALGRRYASVRELRVCSNAGLLDAADPDGGERLGGDADAVVLGHLSNLSAEKGLGQVLDTLRSLRAAGIRARLLLAGPTATPQATALVAAAVQEFGADLEHLGPVPSDEVADFYHRLDVFLFPSRYKHEAEPLVVLEAARAGVPTLASDIGCIAALVPDAEWLVRPDDPFAQAATKIVARLIESPDREQARRAASHAVRDHFAARRKRAVAAQRDLVQELITPIGLT